MTAEDYNAREDTYWFPVFITEFLVIFIINVITITAFARIRHLRKRSTYLIINLTVTDLLVGAITGPLFLYWMKEMMKDEGKHGFEWPRVHVLTFAFQITFPIASQVNLCLISLDRLHATLFPFRHCLISKWFYFKVIIGSWFIVIPLVSLATTVSLHKSNGLHLVWVSFNILTILVLAVSYVIVILNVQRSPHSQNHGLIHTERKLSLTLFIVTGVSALTILPWAIYRSMPVSKQSELSPDVHFALVVIYISSSIVNPLVYTIRMQEFRKAIRNLVCKTTERSMVYPLQP